MKKLTLLLFVFITAHSVIISQDIESLWGNKDETQKGHFYETGQIIPLNITYEYQGGYFEIFGSGANKDLKKGKIKVEKGDRQYFVLPEFRIESVSKPRENYTGEAKMSISMAVEYPDFSHVARFIKNHTFDGHVHSSEVNHIKIFGYEISDPVEEVFTRKSQTSGVALSRHRYLRAFLTYPSLESANIARDEILNGGRFVELTIILNNRILKGSCDISITSKDIYSSQAFRDFDSPVDGATISVNQAVRLTKNLVSEFESNLQCKGKAPTELSERIFEKLFSKTEFLSIDDLDEGDYIVDLDGLRYSADEIKKYSKKITKKDMDDWCTKSHDESNDTSEKNRFKKIDGEVDGDVLWGLVKGKGNGGYEKKNEDKESTFRKFLKENCGKKGRESGFEFEFEGNVVVPKGLFIKELVDKNGNFSISMEANFSAEISQFLQRTFQVSVKK